MRTPFGRYGGALAGVRPDDLAAHVVRTLVARAPALDPEAIDDVFFGNANGAGEDNRDVGRMAVLLAGLPTSVPATTVNRLCGSSLDAAMQASRMVETGDASLTLVGGVESMSRAPWVLLKPERGFPPGEQTLHSTTLGWRMVNPEMPGEWTISLGESTEKLAGIHGIGREAQDEFALRSHRLTAAAWDAGFYDDWVVPVPGTELERDENLRPDIEPRGAGEAEAGVRRRTAPSPPATPRRSTTARRRSGSATRRRERRSARSRSRGSWAAAWPRSIRTSSASARSRRPSARWRRAGIGWDDVELVELNEAFAAQSLACLGDWDGLDLERVNPNGGAIAIGHPLGASGARILGGLARELRRRGGGYGVAAMCIGVGQGLAVVLHA